MARLKSARKPPTKPLKKNQYATRGGPLVRLYLPGLEREGYTTPLPDTVPVGDGLYRRMFDPQGGTSLYVWEDGD